MEAYLQRSRQKAVASSRSKNDYFDDDNDDEFNQSSIKSVITTKPLMASVSAPNAYDDDDVDPLDAFMNDLKDKESKTKPSEVKTLPQIVSDNLYDSDGYGDSSHVGGGSDDSDVGDHQDDDNQDTHAKKRIEPLAAVDHRYVGQFEIVRLFNALLTLH